MIVDGLCLFRDSANGIIKAGTAHITIKTQLGNIKPHCVANCSATEANKIQIKLHILLALLSG